MNKLLASVVFVFGVAGLACSSQKPTTPVPTAHDGARVQELHLVFGFIPHYGAVVAPQILADLHLRQGDPFYSAAVREGIKHVFERERIRVDAVRTEPVADGGVRVFVDISEA
jgi:hypothetical protein